MVSQDPQSPSTNAHVREHYLGPVDGDPAASEIEPGTVWFNTSTNEFRGYNGTSLGTIGFTADA